MTPTNLFGKILITRIKPSLEPVQMVFSSIVHKASIDCGCPGNRSETSPQSPYVKIFRIPSCDPTTTFDLFFYNNMNMNIYIYIYYY